MIPAKLSSQDGLEAAMGAINDLIDWAREIEAETYPLDVINISEELPTHDTKEYDLRALADIGRIVIHHVGIERPVTARSIANYHIRRLGWAGIGYHYFIDREGTIFQTQPLDTVSAHCGRECNYAAVGICLDGSFIDGREPTGEQIAACRVLNAHLLNVLGPNIEIVGHKEVLPTRCPGDNWDKWRDRVTP